MALVLYFLVLLYRTDSTAAQCNVSNCDPGSCAGTNCMKCVAGFYRSSDNKCFECYIQCRTCSGDVCYRCGHSSCYGCKFANCSSPCSAPGNVACTSCPDGYYKIGAYCFHCLHAGCKCNLANSCIACLPGRHGPNCQDSCPSACITCTSINYCTECQYGKYGPTCGDKCISQCADGICDKELGTCSYECPPKQYLDSAQVCRHCPNRCVSCTDSTNCTTCDKEYRWGQTCQYDCTGCYGHCNKSKGCSVHCNAMFYQLYNANKKGYECIRCPDSCVTCRNVGECITCEPDHWGSYCQYNCTGCSKDCYKDDGCYGRCLFGYFQSKIQQGFLCLKCSDNCVICSNATTCIECETGYYPDVETNCVSCSDKCKTGACYTSDGECTDGCIDGWSGQRCNAICPLNCQQCEQSNAASCRSCKIGFYGNSCQNNCSSHCKQENGQQTCQKKYGNCIRGCEDGFWDSTCSELCESGCKGSVCNKTAGECLDGCNVAYYGIHCENKCSSNCETASKSSRQCNEMNGSCEMGCKIGWFENNCTKECNAACKDKTCFQDNGTCVIGYDDDSSTVSSSAVVQCTSESSSTNNAMIIGLSVGIGITALIAVVAITVIVILLIIRQRDHQHQASTRNTCLTLPQQHVTDTSDYQGLDRNEMVDRTYSSITHDYENSF